MFSVGQSEERASFGKVRKAAIAIAIFRRVNEVVLELRILREGNTARRVFRNHRCSSLLFLFKHLQPPSLGRCNYSTTASPEPNGKAAPAMSRSTLCNLMYFGQLNSARHHPTQTAHGTVHEAAIFKWKFAVGIR